MTRNSKKNTADLVPHDGGAGPGARHERRARLRSRNRRLRQHTGRLPGTGPAVGLTVVMAAAVAAAAAGVVAGCGAHGKAEPPAARPPAAGAAAARLGALRYTRIVADQSGISHFADADVTFHYEDFVPPAAPLGVSDSGPTESLRFLTFPAGWVGEWYPAARELFVFILSGRVEVEVGDGEKRTFGPGDAILTADTHGRGHVSRTIGDEAVVSATVALTDD